MKGLKATAILATVCVLGVGITGFATMGVNDAGYTTVVQLPTGTMNTHFEPGWYLKWFGNTTVYNKQITMDADRGKAAEATIDQEGIVVRYSDGGTGTIYGKMRYSLPENREDMLKVHAAFRSNKGVAYKLLKPITEESVNQTAALMKSEEAFDSKRAVFTQWAKAQIRNGLFQTEAEWKTETDAVTGKSVSKQIAVIKIEKGQPLHFSSELKEYGITLVGFQLNNPDFEPKTLTQIDKKRSATMDIITAKANAEKAKQDAITAEATGKANVMTAKYQEEVTKQKAVVVAERVAEVARISAVQKVTVANQATLEATAYKEMQAQLKEANILEGEGLAEKKRLVMEADGALEQKLKALVAMNRDNAVAIGNQKQVSDISFGSTGEATSPSNDLLSMLAIDAAKKLNLDMQVK